MDAEPLEDENVDTADIEPFDLGATTFVLQNQSIKFGEAIAMETYKVGFGNRFFRTHQCVS